MKNIMVFDDCQDYFYDVHAVSDEDFGRIFPGPGQNVEFHDDLYKRPDIDSLDPVFRRMWFNRRSNSKVMGLHGMLFYENWDRKPFYRLKQDIADIPPRVSAPLDRERKTIIIVDKKPDEPIVACQADSELCDILFDRPRQDVIFFEDIKERMGPNQAQPIVERLKAKTFAKRDVNGIDATLYIGYPERIMYFPNRIDSDIPRHYPLTD